MKFTIPLLIVVNLGCTKLQNAFNVEQLDCGDTSSETADIYYPEGNFDQRTLKSFLIENNEVAALDQTDQGCIKVPKGTQGRILLSAYSSDSYWYTEEEISDIVADKKISLSQFKRSEFSKVRTPAAGQLVLADGSHPFGIASLSEGPFTASILHLQIKRRGNSDVRVEILSPKNAKVRLIQLKDGLLDGTYDITLETFELFSIGNDIKSEFHFQVQSQAPSLLANIPLLGSKPKINPDDKIFFQEPEGSSLKFFACRTTKSFLLKDCHFEEFSGVISEQESGDYYYFVKAKDKFGNETQTIQVQFEVYNQKAINEIEIQSNAAVIISDRMKPSETIEKLNQAYSTYDMLAEREKLSVTQTLSQNIFHAGSKMLVSQQLIPQEHSSRLYDIYDDRIIYSTAFDNSLRSFDLNSRGKTKILGKIVRSTLPDHIIDSRFTYYTGRSICQLDVKDSKTVCILDDIACLEIRYDPGSKSVGCLDKKRTALYFQSFDSSDPIVIHLPEEYKTPSLHAIDGTRSELYLSASDAKRKKSTIIINAITNEHRVSPFGNSHLSSLATIDSRHPNGLFLIGDSIENRRLSVVDLDSKKVIKELGLRSPLASLKSSFFEGRLWALEEDGVTHFLSNEGEALASSNMRGFQFTNWSIDSSRNRIVSVHATQGIQLWFGDRPLESISRGANSFTKAVFRKQKSNPTYITSRSTRILEMKETDLMTVQTKTIDGTFDQTANQSILIDGTRKFLTVSTSGEIYSFDTDGNIDQFLSSSQLAFPAKEVCITDSIVTIRYTQGQVSEYDIHLKTHRFVVEEPLGTKNRKWSNIACNESSIFYEADGLLYKVYRKNKTHEKLAHLARTRLYPAFNLNGNVLIYLSYEKKLYVLVGNERAHEIESYAPPLSSRNPYYFDSKLKTLAYFANKQIEIIDLSLNVIKTVKLEMGDPFRSLWTYDGKVFVFGTSSFILENDLPSNRETTGTYTSSNLFVFGDNAIISSSLDTLIYKYIDGNYQQVGHVPRARRNECWKACALVDNRYLVYTRKIPSSPIYLDSNTVKSDFTISPVNMEDALGYINRYRSSSKPIQLE